MNVRCHLPGVISSPWLYVISPEPPMHVIARRRLQDFWRRYPDAERPMCPWLAVRRMRRYTGPHEVRRDFAAASFLKRHPERGGAQQSSAGEVVWGLQPKARPSV